MTTEQLFRKFGGREIVMAVTGASRQAVNHWLVTGVPYKHFPALKKAAFEGDIEGISDRTLESTRRLNGKGR